MCLKKKAPLLLSQGRVGLIVLDSIAAIFRSDFGPQHLKERAKHLTSIGAQLHDLSNKYNAPIICVNQVGKPSHVMISLVVQFSPLITQ